MSRKKREKFEEELEETQDIQEEEKEIESDSRSKSESESENEEADRISELEEKIAELEELRLRDLAEFENIKKRVEKEKQQAIAYAHEQFARDLLAVIDSLDNARASMGESQSTEEALENIKEGIELTMEQFKKVFAKHGIELVDIDSGFDPNFHEAVMRVDSDEHESGQIVQVLQKGYKIKDRVLRPAMVSISN